MHSSARFQFIAKYFTSTMAVLGLAIALLFTTASTATAQTLVPQQPSYTDYRQPDMDPNVPLNNHTYTQAVVIDVLSAIMCNLTGIDPVNPKQPCLGINPVTNKIGYAPQTTGEEQTPQVGGVVGALSNMVAVLYTPTVSSSQYGAYIASRFGIVQPAQASTTPATENCTTNSDFGYGFCGLKTIFSLWAASRDFAYSLLVIAFIALGIGIMLRFKMDARTVMTLQNQIPRVIIAILLITFSYAIAGVMIDLMWTATYAGVNTIAASSPQARVGQGCATDPGGQNPGGATGGQSLGEAATNNLLDNPLSFANRIFLRDCEGATSAIGIDSGVANIAGRVSESFVLLIHSIFNELFGWDDQGECLSVTGGLQVEECFEDFFAWITEILATLIIIIAIIVAMLRLWFELIKAYVSFFIFVILGPIWIVLGLVPGRPLGFEKWLRLIFANLAGFPLVAFILIFARVLLESMQPNPAQILNPNSVFVPPLVGNPNATAFNVLMALGAILIAPTIPAMIREKMGAGKQKFGPTIAAGIAVATGAASAPASKQWKKWNSHDSNGAPTGTLSILRYRAMHSNPVNRIPFVSKMRNMKSNAKRNYYNSNPMYPPSPPPPPGSGSGGSTSGGSGSGSGSGGTGGSGTGTP